MKRQLHDSYKTVGNITYELQENQCPKTKTTVTENVTSTRQPYEIRYNSLQVSYKTNIVVDTAFQDSWTTITRPFT